MTRIKKIEVPTNRLDGGTSDHFSLVVLPRYLLHMVFDVVVHGVGYPQHVVFRRDPRAAALAVLHAPPKRPPTTHTVRHKYVWLVDQL